MSSINSVRKLQILYFSKKNKKIKNLKKCRKKVAQNPHFMHITCNNLRHAISLLTAEEFRPVFCTILLALLL